ncbi:alpha/beta fold hydrolase [Jatrophihabitans fulvus]
MSGPDRVPPLPVHVLAGLSGVVAPGTLERVVDSEGLGSAVTHWSPRDVLGGISVDAGIEGAAEVVASGLGAGVERIDLVAEGYTAPIAVRVAVALPDVVRSLVLIGPSGYARPVSGGIDVRPGTPGMPGVFDALTSGSPAADAALARLAVTTLPEARVDLTALDLVSRWWSSGAFDCVGDPNRQRELRGVRQPVQLVVGRDDAVAGPDSAFFLLRRLRNVQLRMIATSAHLVAVDDPDVLARVVRTFLGVSHEAEQLAPIGTG